jgi:polyisoprenyl-phosphate glycosyltransferase
MKVSALIPAYNEEKTITSVITTLKSFNQIDEIVVIDDGSTDATALLADVAGARVISLFQNKGKGAALQKGIEEIDCDIILILDADLIGLKELHIKRLLEPILIDETDMTIGVFHNGRGFTDFAQLITPNLSGQRAVKRDIISDMEDLKEAGYGVEVAINRYIKKHGRHKFVELPNLTHLMKEEKRGLARGVVDRAKMYWDILKVALGNHIKV